MTKRWTKIFTLGDRNTHGIFDDPVSVTEKVDGSQFNWGIDSKYGLVMLSKGAEVRLGDGNKLFSPAAATVGDLAEKGKLVDGWSYHAETLAAPGHNTLTYERVPRGNLALYGVTREDGSTISAHEDLAAIADDLGIDVVPELFSGVIDQTEALAKINEWLGTVSYLGKEQIEGVVIKNYHKQLMLAGMFIPLIQAKYVSERFKERHPGAWKANNKTPIETVGEMVRTQARWDKAIQHLRESGNATDSVKDIGPLIKLLHQDMEEEDAEVIKNYLYASYIKDLKRVAVRGFPEWFKMRLVDPTITLEQFEANMKGISNESGTKEEVASSAP